ncbi:F-box protein: endocytic membrane traffic, recycling ReCYcling 1, variant 2 [Batrachochytrium dendrobatidis]
MFSTASDPVTPLSANTPVLLQVQEETTIPSNTPVSITTDDPFITTSPSVKTNADGSAPNHRQITSSLPDMRNSSLIIGAGGLKAALAKQAQQKQNSVGYSTIGRNALHKPTNLSLPHLRSSEKSARLVFKQIYEKLSPLYFDFREKQKDSKLFLENKDLSVIGALLCQLRLFDRAGFVSHSDDISFSLETTIEWFESMVIGQFERAYDRTDTAEMRTAATSLYNLNGGLACVNVFISKNQIFFDHTFNPSLVASNLPATTGPSVGYALADDFAKFMDYMLNNCKAQAQLISCIFVPQLNTMTLFVNKVFEDSISEYMTAILVAAKSRENLAIYLHTLATCIYSCSQFIDYISKNETGVYVDVDMSRKVMQDIVGPYVNKYIDQEMEYLNKRFKTELSKWDNRVSSNATAVPPADTFLSAEHVQEHKRFVMKTMKAIMFAPVTLTMSLAHMSTGGKLKPHRQALLNDAEPIASEISPVSTSDRTGVAAYQLDESSINSFVSLELALHLMHANKEALGRCLVVTASTDMSKIRPNVQKVFIALLKAIGERHIKLAFLKAVEHMSKSSPIDSTDNDRMVNMDSLQFFELVHVADLIQQMVDVYYNEDVKIWIDEQDFLSDIIVEKKAFERLLDDGVAGGMDKAIQLLVNQCEFILVSTQPVTEYNPPENGLLDCRPTKACEKVIECLTTHTKLMNGVTEKNTMEVFLGEVGVRLFGVIIKNIRRLQVSQTGALQLICDMNRYYEWATSIRVPSVTKQFAVLKELGNLFLADGSDELRKMVHDAPRYQGALRIEEIYELLQSRTDYKKIQKQVESKECIIQ